MNQSKKLVFSLVIVLITNFTYFTQEDTVSLNQFELNTYAGGSLVKFKYDGGNHRLENQVAPVYGLRLQYNRKINRKFQINAALGLGAHAFTYALPETPSYDYTDREHFFNSFQELYVGTRYTFPLKNNFSFGLNLGGGVTYYSGDFVGISGSYESYGNYPPIETVRIDYLLNFQIVPYAEIGPQISRTFKNKNELSLKLSYVQNFRTIYKGQYQLFNQSSYGTFQNSGSNFKLSLGYTFTGDRRAHKIAVLNEKLSDQKAAKTEYKKQKRYIHPKSIFISLTGGLGFVKSYADDPNEFIIDSYGESLSTRLMVEKGIKNNFFAEAGYQFIEYYSSIRFSYPNGSFSSNEYFTHQLNLGAGYRVIGKKKNYHYFNIHAGFSIGLIPAKKAPLYGFGNVSMSMGTNLNNYTFSFSYESELLSSVILAPYVGISKDFRLTEKMFISLVYRYQHGLNKLSEQSIVYENSSEFTTPQSATNYMNGTEHSIQLGLKFKIGKDQ
jgi:hypothetical protein